MATQKPPRPQGPAAQPPPRGKGGIVVVVLALLLGAVSYYVLVPGAPSPGPVPQSKPAAPEPSTPPPASDPAPSQTTSAPGPPSELPPLPAVGFAPPRPWTVVQAVYEFAARHPEVLRYVPCYCGCESSGHVHNEDCFVSSRDESGRVTWTAHGLG